MIPFSKSRYHPATVVFLLVLASELIIFKLSQGLRHGTLRLGHFTRNGSI